MSLLSAARKKPEDEGNDVSWAFRLMARWLGEDQSHKETRITLSLAEKTARAWLP